MQPLFWRTEQFALSGLLVLGISLTASAQEKTVRSPNTGTAIAFVNVNVITMNDERLQTCQTVLVQGERIAAIGRGAEISLPAGVVVIEGEGRYPAPGLTDAHVHLTTDMPWARVVRTR